MAEITVRHSFSVGIVLLGLDHTPAHVLVDAFAFLRLLGENAS